MQKLGSSLGIDGTCFCYNKSYA